MTGPIDPLEQAISIDRNGDEPLFVQIRSAVLARISAGELVPGVRLPAVRELAQSLGVNRATVTRAYQDLEERGAVESRVGSGTVVAATARATSAASYSQGRLPAVDRPAFSRGILDLARAANRAEPASGAVSIDFAMLLPDVALFPRERLQEAMQVALGRGDEVLQYGSPAGLASLRREVAKRLVSQGIQVTDDEVLIVNGTQQALDLIAKVMLEPGDGVVVESPTYANVLPLLELYGAQTRSVPLDRDGIEIAPLKRSLATQRAKLLYTMPSFHNPTGVTMSLARRKELIDVCAGHGTLIVEDASEQDLYFEDAPLPPLAALGDGIVHLGTFSKGLFPGLRLGYVVAREDVRRLLVLAKRYSDYHADMLSQALLAEILGHGDYDRHLDHLRETYRERMATTVAALEREMPEEIRWLSPTGGYKVWLELPRTIAASTIVREARRRGVAALAGAPFFAGNGSGESGIRLSISRTDPDRIEEGIAILADVLRDELSRSATPGERASTDLEAPPLV